MDRLTHRQRIGTSMPAPQSWFKRIARGLLPLISLTVTLQPAAFAAPTPSLLSQTPMFLDTSVRANVMFLMDDSTSMNGIRLPVPPGLDPAETSGGNVVTAGGVTVARVNEWIYRSSALNPVYYNPAITYRPWNDNGRAGGSGVFTPSSTAFTNHANGFREGLTPHDMRYRGPNYQSGGAPNTTRLSTATGANAPSLPASAFGPANGGFVGLTWVGRNPDLFSSPMVFVTSLTQTCTAGLVGQTSATAPFTLRTDSAQPFTNRVDSAQPFTGRTDSAQSSVPRTDSGQPRLPRTPTIQPGTGRIDVVQANTPRTDSLQPNTLRTDAGQPFTVRSDAGQPFTARSDAGQPFTARSSVAPASAARPTEYQQELVPLCNGTFGTWSTSPPAANNCITGEGITRPAAIQTRLQPCPSGSTESGMVCLSCSAGSTLTGGQCVSDCPGGTVDSNATQCFTACPGGSTQVALGTCRSDCPGGSVGSNATQCFTACPGGSAQVALGTCRSDCPGGTVGSSATQCFTACPGGSAQVALGICRSDCPGGTVDSTATACYSACPGGTTQQTLGICRTDCPGGTVSSTATTCYAACAAGSSAVALGLCRTDCAGGTVGSTATMCYSACPAGSTQTALGTCVSDCPGGTVGSDDNWCYQACPAGNSQAVLGTCRTDCPGGTVGSTATLCYLAACPAGTSQVALGTCRTDCPGGTVASSTTSCFSACPGGTTQTAVGTCTTTCPGGTVGSTGTACYSACPVGTSQTALGTCRTDCPMGAVGSNATQCFDSCPAGTTTSGSQCLSCPAGYSNFGTAPVQCCPSGNITTGNCPVGVTCPTVNQYYIDPNQIAPAQYFLFEPPTAAAPTATELSSPANYRRIEINRDRPQAAYLTGYVNNDPTQGRAVRTDCSLSAGGAAPVGTACTFAEEALNFANWYTYYRTRLFSAIAVTAESFTALSDANNGLDRLRLGYGSINYFPQGQNPYGASVVDRLPSTMLIDNEASVGAIVRGVRPFVEGTNERQEAFDWLFSLRGLGATPNREALDAVGRYFSRDDHRGPWIEPTQPNNWYQDPSINPDPHIACRRTSAILISDGEWTRVAESTPPYQPLMESSSRPALPPAIAAQGDPLSARSTIGPTHAATGVFETDIVTGLPLTPLTLRSYAYQPTTNPQFSTVTGSPSGTLTDVALFWWSRDLRPDLANNIRPIDAPAARRNEAFWQSLTPYIVGYGIAASRDNGSTRLAIANQTALTWPGVYMENRPTENDSVTTDRDVAPINCAAFAAGDLSGCGRVDDTFRAARAARGDFLTATDVPGLAQQIAAAFLAIGEQEGAGTAAAGRSGALQTNDQLFFASFVTNRWTGDLKAYDALAWFAATNANATPVPQWSANFPAAGSRVILTSTAAAAAGATFQWAGMPAAQQAELGTAAVLDYTRGDQSLESPAGPFRRRLSLLGDIVNSQPIYSKAGDDGYGPGRQPAAGGGATYRSYVNAKANVTTGRRATVFVGANAGMLHAFNAADGRELFAYVPRAVYSRLPLLLSQTYTHRYFVDGPVVEGDYFDGTAWRTAIVGTSGAGPKSIFALDVTAPESVGTGSVLWDLTGADHPDIGHILQPGFVASARDGNWYYFVGNGFESANDKARLLAINLRTGALTSIVTDSAGGPNPTDAIVANRPNGLGGISPVYDANRNVVQIYGGDRLGRLWKFDLSGSTVGSLVVNVATGGPLFVATDPSNVRQPITAAPRLTNHPLGGRYVTFGTGKFFERSDKADLQVQSLYALWEKNPASPVAIAKTDLRELTLTDQTVGTQRFRELNGQAAINWNTDVGWYFNLRVGTTNNGERIMVSPSDTLGYLNLTSYEPLANGDPCVGLGQSFYYRLDLASTFQRRAFAGQPRSFVGTRTDPTIAPPNIIRQRIPASTVTLPSPTNAQLKSAIGQATANEPCGGGEAAKTRGTNARPSNVAEIACEGNFMRTWRDLPRD